MKQAIEKAANEALGVEQHKNKYIEKYSEESDDMIMDKNSMLFINGQTTKAKIRKAYVTLRQQCYTNEGTGKYTQVAETTTDSVWQCAQSKRHLQLSLSRRYLSMGA
ncbi:hypothetical protein Trydic_g10997 [Trypoxylus dichotomus]